VEADVKAGPSSEETSGRAQVAPKKRGPRRKVAALDLGGVRVGLALSDELGLYAHPRGVLDGRNRVALVQTLAALVTEENIGRFVVGLPLDMRGGEGEAARKARRLAQAIADATGCEIELWDERLSTVEARRHLAASDVHGARAKAHIDEASACILLQAWLDRKAARRSP
jgi:putative Holliday junction resolvase